MNHNPVDLALTEVVNNIPPQILEVALRTYNRRTNSQETLVSFITKAIIHERILKHCNLSAGSFKTIPMRQSWIEYTSRDHAGFAGDDGPFTIFRIPPEFRDNLPIAGVLSCQFPYNTYLGGGIGDLYIGTGGYSLNEQIDQILNSYTMSSPRNHPIAKLLSGDLIKLIPSQYARQNWLLSVRIAYNDAFTNMEESEFEPLADLVVTATKQWCYNNLKIDIDRAIQETGCDINSFKEEIEKYSDMPEKFKENLTAWRGSALLTTEMRQRILAYQI